MCGGFGFVTIKFKLKNNNNKIPEIRSPSQGLRFIRLSGVLHD